MPVVTRLALDEVSLAFGGVTVLDRVGFDVEDGSIVGLVGPNGAGKTSLFNCISGHYRPDSGTIRIGGIETLTRAPWRLSRLGLARTFQHPALRLDASVLENVMLGAHTRLRGGPFSWAFRLPGPRAQQREIRDEALDLLDRFGLAAAAHTSVDELSHGLHKSVEICRALLSRPTLLLLDEPAAGLSHGEVTDLVTAIGEIRGALGVTLVVVEHNMGLVAAVTDKVVVLDHGRKLMEGTAAEVQNDPRVIEAYLGKKASS